MAVLDSYAATVRASAQVGKADGSGACLANVYKWFGSVQSIGPGAGQYDWAIKGWRFSTKQHPGDANPPAGVPVYFDAVGAPRWRGDKNYPCGDIGLSLGNGYAVFTDSPTGNTGIMSLSARAAQIGRPYLGWTEDFLGHDTQAGQAAAEAHKPPVIVPNLPLPPAIIKIITGDSMAENIKVNGKHLYTVGLEYIHWHSAEGESNITRNTMSTTDETHNMSRDQAFGLLRGLGIPTAFLDIEYLRAHGWNDTWSRLLEIQGAVKGIQGIKQLPGDTAGAVLTAQEKADAEADPAPEAPAPQA